MQCSMSLGITVATRCQSAWADTWGGYAVMGLTTEKGKVNGLLKGEPHYLRSVSANSGVGGMVKGGPF